MGAGICCERQVRSQFAASSCLAGPFLVKAFTIHMCRCMPTNIPLLRYGDTTFHSRHTSDLMTSVALLHRLAACNGNHHQNVPPLAHLEAEDKLLDIRHVHQGWNNGIRAYGE